MPPYLTTPIIAPQTAIVNLLSHTFHNFFHRKMPNHPTLTKIIIHPNMICTPKVRQTFGVHITIAWFFFISIKKDRLFISPLYIFYRMETFLYPYSPTCPHTVEHSDAFQSASQVFGMLAALQYTVKFSQPINAPSFTAFTLAGMTIFVKLLHPKNA